MAGKKKEHPKEKSSIHPRNKHKERYDFKLLFEKTPELKSFVKPNIYNDNTIDFFDPEAVKSLNKALLKQYYDIEYWDIPAGYLCPPIPGRANYIHHIADLMRNSNYGKIPLGNTIKCLDIGVGANCVYPMIGIKEYGWSFVGSDIDEVAIESANKIVELNAVLKGKIELRPQIIPKDIFKGIIQEGELVDLTICNPPFHGSAQEAEAAAIRKLSNLLDKEVSKPILNFGGKGNELWCEGGEESFVNEMIAQSKRFAGSCFWFSTLISKQSTLKRVTEELKSVNPMEVKTISMGQGNKTTRILAWTYLKKEQQRKWAAERWKETAN
ncbi:MAG: 23S rRNA (adenine(1618)-N(6))-methyltransferase RlmF [Cytophagales bacterium]